MYIDKNKKESILMLRVFLFLFEKVECEMYFQIIRDLASSSSLINLWNYLTLINDFEFKC